MNETEALRALDAILSRPEFTPPKVSLWQVLWAAVWELVRAFLSWLFAPVQDVLAGRTNWLQLAALVLAIALLVAAAWFVARVLSVSIVRDAAATATAAGVRRQRSDSLWREAQELAAAGHLAEAVRTLYVSALYALEEHDVLRVEQALTNREHAVRLLHTRPEAGDTLLAVVQHYEPVRYGASLATPETFHELETLVQRLRSTAA